MKKLAITFGLLILIIGIVFAQDRASLEKEFDRLHDQLLNYAATNQDTPEEIEARYFELERLLYPERQARIPDNYLDQGSTTWPGDTLWQPEIGSDTLTLFDWGTTNEFSNDCPYFWQGDSGCGRGPDVFYTLMITRQDCVKISTCGTHFDTRLCVYKEDPLVPGYECCQHSYLYARVDSSVGICDDTDRISSRAVLAKCFLPGEYHIVLDGQSSTSDGSYVLEIEFFDNDCITPEPKPECPKPFKDHMESAGFDEEPCGFTTLVPGCPQGYCGIIDGPGDLDVFQITIEECYGLRASLWADATENAPGGTGYDEGLDGSLKLYMTTCEALISKNDDIGTAGIPPVFIGGDAPEGTDSQISYDRAVPGTTYYFVVGGEDGTTGPYEFLIECYNCEEE
jgi:hypothetical protein